MKKILLICLLGNFFALCQQEQQVSPTQVEIKYRKYEKFNLKDLVIEGKVIVPGDLAVKELSEVDLRRKLYEKPHFKDEIIRDLTNL